MKYAFVVILPKGPEGPAAGMPACPNGCRRRRGWGRKFVRFHGTALGSRFPHCSDPAAPQYVLTTRPELHGKDYDPAEPLS